MVRSPKLNHAAQNSASLRDYAFVERVDIGADKRHLQVTIATRRQASIFCRDGDRAK